MANKYKGFSTIKRTKKFHITDYELVKQDLINHFSIKKGQKLMNPNFGTIVWSILFEPMTEDVKSIIVEDVKRIVNYDPRTKVESVLIDEFEQGLQIQVDLVYLPGNFANKLTLEFNSTNDELTVV